MIRICFPYSIALDMVIHTVDVRCSLLSFATLCRDFYLAFGSYRRSLVRNSLWRLLLVSDLFSVDGVNVHLTSTSL